MNKWEREQFFLIEFQLISVEGMMEIENHHLTNGIEILVVGRNHQWILKINGQKYDEKKQTIFRVSKFLFSGYNGKNSNFTVEQFVRHHLNQVF